MFPPPDKQLFSSSLALVSWTVFTRSPNPTATGLQFLEKMWPIAHLANLINFARLVLSKFSNQLPPSCPFLISQLKLITGGISTESHINLSSHCRATYDEESYRGYHSIYGKSITIFTPADVDAISACTTFNGTIRIDPSFPRDLILPNLQTVDRGGIYAVAGLIDFDGSQPVGPPTQPSNLTGLIFPRLYSIGADISGGDLNPVISISSMANLTTIWFAQLRNFWGKIVLDELPALTNLSNFYIYQTRDLVPYSQVHYQYQHHLVVF